MRTHSLKVRAALPWARGIPYAIDLPRVSRTMLCSEGLFHIVKISEYVKLGLCCDVPNLYKHQAWDAKPGALEIVAC
jgi:hypothetical protein